MNALSALLALLTLFGAGSAFAAPIVDTFTFSGTRYNNVGTVVGTGTVTGTIQFASAGSNVAATVIHILSAPANVVGSGDGASTNFVLSVYPFEPTANSFTVEADGTIDAANFNSVTDFGGGTAVILSYGHAELHSYSSGYDINTGSGSSSGIVFASASPAAVPEPATLVLLGGAGLMAVVRRRA